MQETWVSSHADQLLWCGSCESGRPSVLSQAQHVAEAAIEERNAARKARKRAEETVAEYEAATFKQEQMEARVADLQWALMAQQAEETSFSSGDAVLLPLHLGANVMSGRMQGWCTSSQGCRRSRAQQVLCNGAAQEHIDWLGLACCPAACTVKQTLLFPVSPCC